MSFLDVSVSRAYRSPCSRIWELLTDTEAWPQWGPSVKAVECEKRFIQKGTEGRVKTAAGFWLNFVITGYEEGRFWTWRVAGIPATGHRLEPRDEGYCHLTFQIPLLAYPYKYVCRIALNRIAALLD